MCKTIDLFDNTEYDLTPLISTTKNYLADVSDKLRSTEGPPMLVNSLMKQYTNLKHVYLLYFLQYYLNVCKPLVTQYGLSCPGGSAACRAENTSTTPYKEQVKDFINYFRPYLV